MECTRKDFTKGQVLPPDSAKVNAVFALKLLSKGFQLQRVGPPKLRVNGSVNAINAVGWLELKRALLGKSKGAHENHKILANLMH